MVDIIARCSTQRGNAYIPLFRHLVPLLLLMLTVTALFTTAIDGKEAINVFQRIAPLPAFAAILLAFVPWFTDAARAMVWCRFLGRQVPYVRLVRIVAVSELGAAVAPPVVGTVPVKTVLLAREGLTSGEALSLTTISSLEDWVFYLIAFPFCLAISGPASFTDLQFGAPDIARIGEWTVGCGIVVFLAAWIFRKWWLWIPDRVRIRNRFGRFSGWIHNTWRDLAAVYRLIIARGAIWFLFTLLLTAVQWGCRYSVATVLIGGMGLPSQPALFFSLQIVIYGLTTFVPTPGGTGGAEALFALIHRPFLPGASLGAVTAAWRVTTFYFPVIVSLIIAYVTLAASRSSNGQTDRTIAPPQPG
jgi:uncharacterized protein (TIRG00374 family)